MHVAVNLVRAYCHLCVVTCDSFELYEFCLQVEIPGIFNLSFCNCWVRFVVGACSSFLKSVPL